LRCCCSCASSFDVVATHFRIHDLILHTSWTPSRSENQLSTVPCSFFEVCLNHSSSLGANRSCGMDEDDEERSTYGLYDLRLGGRRRKCVEEGRVVRRVCVVSNNSAGSACACAAALLVEVSECIYSKTPEIIERLDGEMVWNMSRAVLSVREIVSRATSIDCLTSRTRLFGDLTSALCSGGWPLVSRPFECEPVGPKSSVCLSSNV
jgi:hypothetical protein